MDPVTHTLVGASLAATGLKKRSALGTATLLIGANLPDIDMLSYVAGPTTALWFRRGATHGVLAVLVLPFVLTGLMIGWDRLARRRQRPLHTPRVVPREILKLAASAIATHPLLDFLNTYGMRWLMPFSDTWSYADTLFIVDPWIWAMLAVGIFLTRKRERDVTKGEGGKGKGEREGEGEGAFAARMRGAGPTFRPSAVPSFSALAILIAYIAALGISSVAARGVVTRSLGSAGLPRPSRVMVAPVPVNPFRRWVVVETAGVYRFGSFRWFRSPKFVLDVVTYERHPSHFAGAAATRGPEVRKFLSWARFPYSLVEESREGYTVRLGDARYTLDPEGSWAGMTVVIDK